MAVLVVDHRPRQLAAVQRVGAELGQQLDAAGQLVLATIRSPTPDVSGRPGAKIAAASGVPREDRPDRGRTPLPGRRWWRRPRRRRGRRQAPASARAAGRSGGAPHAARPPRPAPRRRPTPTWKTWVVCSSNGTSTCSTSTRRRPAGRSRPGIAVNASSSAGSRRGRPHHHEAAAARAGQRRLGRPRHRPRRDDRVDRGATARPAPSAPARAVSSWPAAIAPRVHRADPTSAGSWAARAGRPAAAPAAARREPRRPAACPGTRSPVATTVTHICPASCSSTEAPKMMLVRSSAAARTISAASFTSCSDTSLPPEIESRMPRAPRTSWSISGLSDRPGGGLGWRGSARSTCRCPSSPCRRRT